MFYSSEVKVIWLFNINPTGAVKSPGGCWCLSFSVRPTERINRLYCVVLSLSAHFYVCRDQGAIWGGGFTLLRPPMGSQNATPPVQGRSSTSVPAPETFHNPFMREGKVSRASHLTPLYRAPSKHCVCAWACTKAFWSSWERRGQIFVVVDRRSMCVWDRSLWL